MSTRLEPGTVLAGDFEIVRMLGEGGMGAVYEARQRSTGALRAVKVMRPDLVVTESARKRFEQEAHVVSQIDSEHVVTVLSAGIDRELHIPYIAMELLRGEDLAQMVARGPLDLETAYEIFAQLGHALSAAHSAGVVHRDLKLANVFVSPAKNTTRRYTVKVLDFGISKVMGTALATQTGALGTPAWMAPEQTTRGGHIGPQTDVWALGLLAFYALTGKSYWLNSSDGDPIVHVIREITLDPIEPASWRAGELKHLLPAGFDAFFARSVTRDLTVRYRDATEAVPELLDVLTRPLQQTTQLADQAPRSVPNPFATTTPFVQIQSLPLPPSPATAPTAHTTDAVANTTALGAAIERVRPSRSRYVFMAAAVLLAGVAVWVARANMMHASAVVAAVAPSGVTPDASPLSPAAPASFADATRVRSVHVSGEVFFMGSMTGADDEKPLSKQSVGGFDIDATEVTTRAYLACVAAKHCEPAATDDNCNAGDPDKLDHPINCVTFNQAKSYCEWQNKRLPLEPEWEIAARGPELNPFPWGKTPPTDDQLCWKRETSRAGTCPVGSFPRSNTNSGITGLSGNVSEWTMDKYCPYDDPACHDERRVIRGGGWATEKPHLVSTTVRLQSVENNKSPTVGFRCVRSL